MKTTENDLNLPDWFQDLIDAIKGINIEAITEPIVGLYTGIQIEGWTIPPFICIICGEKFEGDDAEKNYGAHLISHMTAFMQGWFPDPEEEP